ncbi:MAG: hypothetical protein LUE14_02995 [Clostridiales bacterium]|nr:hypothetical protein [Clostridiales bacterium]
MMNTASKYTEEDLINLIALCSQSPENFHACGSLLDRCEKALAYSDIRLRLTERDKEFLRSVYDEDMDAGAKKTLEKVLHAA